LSGSLDGGVSWQTIIAVVAAAASFIVALINAVAAYYRDKQTQQELYAAERRFEQFKVGGACGWFVSGMAMHLASCVLHAHAHGFPVRTSAYKTLPACSSPMLGPSFLLLSLTQKELEDRQRRLIRFENVQELMKQYKKPLLQASFDLQVCMYLHVHAGQLFQLCSTCKQLAQ
jgi:hypothetical protein